MSNTDKEEQESGKNPEREKEDDLIWADLSKLIRAELCGVDECGFDQWETGPQSMGHPPSHSPFSPAQ